MLSSVQDSGFEAIANSQPIGIPMGLIEGEVEGFRYFFNAKGHHGAVVLFGESLEVFERCRNGSDVREIAAAIPWARSDPRRFERILTALGRIELIDLGSAFSERLADERLRLRTRTMDVWLQVTDACNLRCSYCYVRQKPTHMSIDVGKAVIAGIKADCGNAGFEAIVFKFAGGEPTLRWPEIKALLDWAQCFKNASPNVRFHIITNATALPLDLVDYLVAGKLRISVSLDGVDQWHDTQRFYPSGRGSFLDVDANIAKLLARGIRPLVLTTVTRKNVGGLTELAEYCIERDLPFRFSLYRDPGLLLADLQNENTILIHELLRCYAWMAGHLPNRSLYEYHNLGDISLRSPKRRACGIGVNGLSVTSEGKIALCQYEMNDPLGSATDNVVELLKHQDRYSLVENCVDHIPQCRTCRWRFACAAGCPYLTKYHFGTFRHPSPYCEAYQAVLPVLLSLHALQLIRAYKTERR